MPARINRRPVEPSIKRLFVCLVACVIVAVADEAHAWAGYTSDQSGAAQDAPDEQRELARRAFAEGERLRAELTKQSLQEAAGKYAEAHTHWLYAGSQREAAAALEAVGETQFILSEYDKALTAYRMALSMRRAMNDDLGSVGALNGIGYTYVYLGQNQLALSNLGQAMALLKKPQTPGGDDERARKEAQLQNSLGEVYYSLSDVKNALDSFNRARALWTRVGDVKGEALADLNLGYMNYNFGDLKGARELYNRSLTLSLSTGDRRGEAFSRTALGGVHSYLGEQQAALDLHNEALKIFSSIGDREGEAVTLNGIGTAYQRLNKPREALDNYDRAMGLYHDIGNRDFEALSKVYVATVHRAAGETEQALYYYNESLALLRKVGNRRIETYVRNDLATIYGSSGRTRSALREYVRALKLYKGFDDKRGLAGTLNGIADIYYSSGQARKALSLYERSLSLSREAQDRGAEISTTYKLARAERDAGEIDQALSRVETAIKLIEGLRVKAGGPDQRASYFASVHQDYELYVDLLMEMHRRDPAGGFASAALYASERSRARSLLEMLAEARVDIRRGAHPALVEEADSLARLLDARAEYLVRVLSAGHGKDDVEGVNAEIRGLAAQYDQVQAQILEQSSLYLTLTQPKLLRLEDIQAELEDDNTLLLEYALGEERSYLWAITSDSLESYELPGRATLEDAAREVYGLLTARQPVRGESQTVYDERVATSDARYRQRALALSRMLLGKLSGRLGKKRLIVVAEGALQYIPFEALPIASPGGGEEESNPDGLPNPTASTATLVADHEIVYLQSASMLTALRRDRRLPEAERKGVAVLADPVFGRDDPRVRREAGQGASPEVREDADLQGSLRAVGEEGGLDLSPLPSTLDEANAIVDAAPYNSTRVATCFQANKEAVTGAEFGKYKVLHFATHGIINNEQPKLSGVVLSLVDRRGKPQSGFLRLTDIYKLDLSADLVVLSACRSALGQHLSGEGFVGLTRGFIYAGSGSVVASLWKVDDEATAELMRHFYHAMLKEGLPPAAALQKAKLKMQAHPRWHHPFYWAAFVIQGEYREPIKIKGYGVVHALLLAAAIVALAPVFYSVRRGRKSAA